MNAIKALASYRRLRGLALWRLLAADHGPVIMALLQAHLLGEVRSIPASILHERLEKDIEVLRGQGEELPQTAQAYVSDWLTAGYLVRRFPTGAPEEEYELSADAAASIRFISSLMDRRTTATESRLSMVIQQLVRLVEETDPNPDTRIAGLLAESARLNREIEEVRQGRFRALPQDRALERVREILVLAGELTSDFRNVRDEFEQLNRELRERIIDSEGSRGTVLEALFAGVDVIADSDAGRTFYAFWRLLTDPAQSTTVEDAVENVLARDFSGQLSFQERRFLSRLIQTLLDQGGMVHEVLQHFARSLKQFVQSREYQEQRRLNQLLKQAQQAALAVKERIRITDVIEQPLQLTSSRIRSVSQWLLYDPSLNAVERGMADGASPAIDLVTIGALVAQSEIDFRSLKANVRSYLQQRSQVSIKDVMELYPATQGLGSAIGYVALGSRHGIHLQGRSEIVSWVGEDDEHRSARIPYLCFVKEREHELE